MTLRQFLKPFSLWGSINSIESFPFIQDPIKLDLLQVVNYGDRKVFKGFIDLTDVELAEMIIIHFKDKWNHVVNIDIENIDLTSDNTKRTKIISNKVGKISGSENTENKVSGYNAQDLILDTGNEVVKVEDMTGDELIEKIEFSSNLKSLFNNLSIVDQSNIIDIVLLDVAKFLTISLYEG